MLRTPGGKLGIIFLAKAQVNKTGGTGARIIIHLDLQGEFYYNGTCSAQAAHRSRHDGTLHDDTHYCRNRM